jgi:hypothetical protein
MSTGTIPSSSRTIPATAPVSPNCSGVIQAQCDGSRHGTLKSSKSACTTGRTVKLYREKPGRDTLLGTDMSNGKTKWSIPIGKRLTTGSYYVKAPAKGSCKPAKSKALKII